MAMIPRFSPLDDDDEISNESRVAKAQGALAAYAEDDGNELGDLLTDLRHWAAANDVDFEEVVERSRNHFLAEASDDADVRSEAREALRKAGH